MMAVHLADIPQVLREVTGAFPSPQDWRDIPIYFLLVDRFNNPSAPPRFPFDSEESRFQGGTLKGVEQQLSYLQGLGFQAIWLSPVLANPQFDEFAYHGYGIRDFLTVEPRFTSDPDRARQDPAFAEDELRSLVTAAHARGMYVILDIVLNHVGDTFEYPGFGGVAPFRSDPYPVRWRDRTGSPTWSDPPGNGSRDETVWPPELRRNGFFRRQGNAFEGAPNIEKAGDFFSLKEMVTEFREIDGTAPVLDTLILAYQYIVAAFDIDGYRIDTLKFIAQDSARIFGNAIREYALSIGKKNFFTYGEIFDDEEKIAQFVGRNVATGGDLVGVDAALDFPLFYALPNVAKGLASPGRLVEMFERRKRVQREIVSSHGEVSRFYVTFLDNHDVRPRFYFEDPTQPDRYNDQVSLALTCLATLQGIPCVYYGTEQGLHGDGSRPEAVREALWGKPDPFDPAHPFAAACRAILSCRDALPALRYGRQYFRPVSGDAVNFGISPFPGGIISFSRILSNLEVLVVANTNTTQTLSVQVIVDLRLNAIGASYIVRYTNKGDAESLPQSTVTEKGRGSVVIGEVDGSTGTGPIHVIDVTLRPMEVQILTS